LIQKNLDDGASGLLSSYTAEMRKVIDAYFRNSTPAADTYYLFVVEGAKDKNKMGYMPRKKQAGFLFTSAITNEYFVHTLAHELGHGAFRLEHTFEEYATLGKGTTDNLMDYGTGTRLNKYQWDLIHDPVAVLGLFEDDEESALAGIALEAYVKGFSLHESYYAVEGGLIPDYLWKSGMVNPIAAGFIDGAWQTIEGTWGIVKFLDAWKNPFGEPLICTPQEALEIRLGTWQFVQFLNELVTNPETRAQTWNALKASFSDYIDETLGLDNQALYNQGKLVFDVITLFIGVGEVKAILNGQKVTIGIVALMQAVPKHLSKLVFRLKNFGLSLVKSGDNLSILGKQGGEVAALVKTADGSVLQVPESGWLDEDLGRALDEFVPAGSFTIETKGGSVSKWNMVLNRILRSNAIYKIDQYIFETDHLARVKKIVGELKLQSRGRNTYQQGKAVEIKDGLPGDQGGHLIAEIFYGPGEQINYLPMKSTLNQSSWKQMENTLKKALEEGKKVDIEIRPVFEGASKRPSAFEVDYWLNGIKKTEFFDN
jgi:hypothetical protein